MKFQFKRYFNHSIGMYFQENIRQHSLASLLEWRFPCHYNGHDCCNRWYFTFNGAECSSPAAIDGVFLVYQGTSWKKNPHRPRHIEGICEKLHKGTVRVGFWVGKCAGGYKTGDAYTGWNSVSKIYIEEVAPPQP